jgi:hypothetical protein
MKTVQLTFVVALAAVALMLCAPVAGAQSPAQGPGGPILVVTDSGDSYGTYYAEILRAEGLNEFAVADKSALNPSTLAGYDVVVLASVDLDDAQATVLSSWVQGGGNLIAMQPDVRLASLLGLGAKSGTLANGYLAIDTSSAPGAGVTGATMQFHGSADRYALNGARAVATLYNNATSPTTNPAVTLRAVGGGEAAAFTYSLAQSVVLTRQGNPAWAGQERDGFLPKRSDDLFFGAKAGDVQPDWVDFNKIAIPQADEQQRLLANLIEQMNLDRKPLPRFWYLPSGDKAAVVMTGDDHANGGTAGRFDSFEAASPAGCSVADWQCVRGTSYAYPNDHMTDVQAAQYQALGFEIGVHLHVSSGTSDCNDFPDAASLDADLSAQMTELAQTWPSLARPTTTRTHCIVWSDWSTEAQVEAARGFRLDENYYYWPGTWVNNRPGLFTGSGMPMRFADQNGSLIDIYQAATQLTDESGQTIPTHIKTLLDNALGSPGYYAVITANMHTDDAESEGAQQILAEAIPRGVPIVSAKQMATWLDGRNSSAFGSIAFANGNALTFSVSQGAGARNLRGMVPMHSANGVLQSLTRDGSAVSTTTQTIKGIEYAFFAAAGGNYTATYTGGTPAAGGAGSTAGRTGSSSSGTTSKTKKTLPRVKVSPKKVRASRSGIVTLRVFCPKSARHCRVNLHLQRAGKRLAQNLVVVGGGKTARVRLHLTRSARAQLARARALFVEAVAAAKDDAKRHATTTTRIRILAPKRGAPFTGSRASSWSSLPARLRVAVCNLRRALAHT